MTTGRLHFRGVWCKRRVMRDSAALAPVARHWRDSASLVSGHWVWLNFPVRRRKAWPFHTNSTGQMLPRSNMSISSQTNCRLTNVDVRIMKVRPFASQVHLPTFAHRSNFEILRFRIRQSAVFGDGFVVLRASCFVQSNMCVKARASPPGPPPVTDPLPRILDSD